MDIYMNCEIQTGLNHNFYAPIFEEIEGAYWFGLICPSICLLRF